MVDSRNIESERALRTVQFGARVEVSRVRSENHPASLVSDRDHLIVDGLEVEVCHDV